VPTPEEIRRLRAERARRGAGTQARQPARPSPLVSVTEEEDEGGFLQDLGRLGTKLITPLVDLPDQSNPILRFAERGLEELSSPIGLASAALFPVTGGASLGLSGVAGAGARLATRGIAEAATGAAASTLASEVGERLPEGTPGPIRLAATLGAGVIGGGAAAKASGAAVRRLPGAPASRSVAGGISTKEVDDALRQVSAPDPDVAPLVDALVEARKQLDDPAVRSQLKAERRLELGRRIGVGAPEAARATSGAGRMQAALSAQRGKLPALDFPKIELDEDVIEKLVLRTTDGIVNPNARLSFFDSINATKALEKIVYAGEIPSRSEMILLEKVFGPQLVEAVENLRPYGAKEFVLDIINLPRSIMASADLSFGLRQGVMAIGMGPKMMTEFARGNLSGAKAFASPQYHRAIDDLVRGRAGNNNQRAITDALTRWGVEFTGSGVLPEEAFQAGRLGRKLFGSNEAGRIMAGSERSFTTTGNYIRWANGQRIANQLAELYGKQGQSIAEKLAEIPQSEAELLAKTLNVITGRSGLKFLKGEQGRVANAMFFAPNFLASRFIAPTLLPKRIIDTFINNRNLLKDPDAVRRAYLSDPITRLQAEALGGFIAQGMIGMGSFKLASEMGWIPDFDIETDPRSSAFGKVKWDDTEYDFWAGYAPMVRAFARTLSGESKTRSGAIQDTERLGVIWDQFIRSKAAPIPGMFWDAKTGTNIIGEKVSFEDVPGLEREVRDALLPLFIQDALEALREQGLTGIAKTTPAFIGIGVSNFTTIGQVRDSEAQRLFKKPFLELTQGERQAVNQTPRVLEKERERNELQPDDSFSATKNKIDADRIASEEIIIGLLASGQITRAKAAEMISEQQRSGALLKRQAAEQFNIQTAPKDSLLDQGLDAWFSLYDLADYGAEKGIKTGEIDYDKFAQLEHELFQRLTPLQIEFIEDRVGPAHADIAQSFFDNRSYVNDSGYNEIADEEFDKARTRIQRVIPEIESYGQLLAAVDFYRLEDPALYRRLNPVARSVINRVDDRRKTMRRRNPDLDAALYLIGRTSSFQTKKAERLAHGS
jgi:hypothetical protein